MQYFYAWLSVVSRKGDDLIPSIPNIIPGAIIGTSYSIHYC